MSDPPPAPTPYPNVSTSPAGDPVELRIIDLVRDPELQMRDALHPDAITRYAAALTAGHVLPPVEVVDVGGPLLLCDGWHRVEAHARAGRLTITAYVVSGTRADALKRAAVANLTNGVPLKRKELRTAFRAFVAAGGHLTADDRGRERLLSYDALCAALPGLKKATAWRWMQEDHPDVFAAMQRSKENRDAAPATGTFPAPDPAADTEAEALAWLHNARNLTKALPAERREAVLVAMLRALREDELQLAPGTEHPDEAPAVDAGPCDF